MGALEWLKDNASDLATGALVMVVAVVAAVGRIMGKKPEQSKVAELAGAIIDSADTKAIIAAVNSNTAALQANTAKQGEAVGLLDKIHDKLIEGVAQMRPRR